MSLHLVPPRNKLIQNNTKKNSNEKIPKKTTVSTTINIQGNPRPQLRTAKSSSSNVTSYSDYTPGADNKSKSSARGAVNAEELSRSLLGLKKSTSSLSLPHVLKKKNKNNESSGSCTPISPRTSRRSGGDNLRGSSNGKISPTLKRSNSPSLSSIKAGDTQTSSPSSQNSNSISQAHNMTNNSGLLNLEYISSKLDDPNLKQTARHSRSYRENNTDAFNFKPIIDLSILNSYELLKQNLYFPTFQVLKYNNFLNNLTDHHQNDPVSFASVRHHSLINFISCYKLSEQFPENLNTKEHDLRFYETLLTYELLRSRTIFRESIKIDSAKIENKSKIINCEELVQLNVSNYVRFVLTLPDQLPVPYEQLDSTQRTHLRYKELFEKIGHALYLMNKEVGGDENPNASSNYVLQTIRKVSYEYFLLEKYLIHILTKLGNNSLIESRNLKRLFDEFNSREQSKSNESIKVLHYNAYFSSQYSWYLAITAPFLRIYEMNSYSENSDLVNSYEDYYRNLKNTTKISFKELDLELHEHYFRHLGLNDYTKFHSLTPEKLVALHKSIYKSQRFKKSKKIDLGNGQSGFSHKPMNFEYYTESLSTICSETFDLIQSRDLVLQLTPNNYSVILREFHRILKNDGIVEIPFIQLSRNKIKETFQEQGHDFSNDEGLLDLNLLEQFNMIPDFVQTILKELTSIFGKESVKYHMSLLNSIGELNSFLGKHICFQIFEMFGRLDDYCTKFNNGDDSNVLDINKDGLYYYIYIKAQKK